MIALIVRKRVAVMDARSVNNDKQIVGRFFYE